MFNNIKVVMKPMTTVVIEKFRWKSQVRFLITHKSCFTFLPIRNLSEKVKNKNVEVFMFFLAKETIICQQAYISNKGTII